MEDENLSEFDFLEVLAHLSSIKYGYIYKHWRFGSENMIHKYGAESASMPGAQRLDENGIPKCKNYCKINGRYVKYEPIYVFRKPD